MKIVFDTYAWVEFFEGTRKGKIVNEYLENEEVLTPSIVLLELSYRADQEGWDFKGFFNFIKSNSQVIGLNEEFILSFGEIYNKMKKKVKDISMADVVILHTAALNDAKVLTGDEHFKKTEMAIMLE